MVPRRFPKTDFDPDQPSERPVFIGAPERIRTSDPQIRSLVLYPAELRARACREGCRRADTALSTVLVLPGSTASDEQRGETKPSRRDVLFLVVRAREIKARLPLPRWCRPHALTEHEPPPSTQNFEQWGWLSLTAPASNMPPSRAAAWANVPPMSKRSS